MEKEGRHKTIDKLQRICFFFEKCSTRIEETEATEFKISINKEIYERLKISSNNYHSERGVTRQKS